MKKSKRIIAAAIALVSALGMAACGGSSSDTQSSSYVDKVEVQATDEIDAIPDDADKEIEWFSYFDINPTKAANEKRTDLTLFESKGGKIKYSQTSSMTKYDQLASRLMSADPPDMFWYEARMTFPANCIKDMFQPIDSIVDFDTPLWSDVKDTAEQFSMNGEHYVAPTKYLPMTVLTYDKSMIEAAQLDDPYELYQDGEWNWNTWYDMMDEYCSGASADEERYGINGWFAPFIFQGTGKSLINYDSENSEYVSNLYDADFEKAADLLYNISKNGMYYFDWIGQSSDAFKKNILFYAMGPWASIDTHTPKDGEEWGMVPVPKNADTDEYYMGLDINAYMWVKGSTKSDAMKCWMECAKLVNTDQSYKDTEKQKFMENNPNWTEDMYDLVYDELVSDKFTFTFEPGNGISTTLSDDNAATNDTKEAVISLLYSSVLRTDENGAQYTWTQLRESYSSTIESELKTFNAEYKKYIGAE